MDKAFELPEYAISFFSIHNIPIEITIDARGTGATNGLKAFMKEQRKPFAYNTAPCTQGHKIKTRHGHCPVCDTARVQFALKADSYGVLYIAGSIKAGIIKIGSSTNAIFREESLNKTKYATFSDWKIIWSANCMNAISVESKVHSSLNIYKFQGMYKHDNHLQKSIETYRCNYETAKNAILDVIDTEKVELFNSKEILHIIKNYNFNNVLFI